MLTVVLIGPWVGPASSQAVSLSVPISATPVVGLSDSCWSDAHVISFPRASGTGNVTVWLKYDWLNRSFCLRFRGPDDTYDSSDSFSIRLDAGVVGRELDANCRWFYINRGGSPWVHEYNVSSRSWHVVRYRWTAWCSNGSNYWEAAFSIPLQLARNQTVGLCLWQQDVSLPPRTWRVSNPYPAGSAADVPITWASVGLDRRTNLTLSVSPGDVEFDPVLRRPNTEVVVSGSLAPSIVTAITITYTRPDGSIYTTSSMTNGFGEFGETLVPDMAGTWLVRASWEGNSELDPSTSEQVQLHVSYGWLTVAVIAAGIALVAFVGAFIWKKRSSRALPPPPPP